jgi:hypothetical protein
MVFELALAAYCAACGFVAAGLIASLIQLITGRPARFAVELESTWTGLRDCVMIALCGPFILMRNAIRGRLIENRPIGWLMASSVIALMWSACSGVFVLQLAFAASQGLI